MTNRCMTFAELDQKFIAPMNQESSMSFIECSMMETALHEKGEPIVMSVDDMIKWFEDKQEGLSKRFYLAIPMKRLEYARDNEGQPMLFSPLVLSFVASSFCDRVGMLVFWAYTLAEETRKGGPITIDRLATKLFPWGFPNYDGFVECWEAQKIDSREFGTDNWVDLPIAWDPNANSSEKPDG